MVLLVTQRTVKMIQVRMEQEEWKKWWRKTREPDTARQMQEEAWATRVLSLLLTVLSGVSTHTHTEARAISVSLCLVWLAPAPSSLAGLPVTHRRLAGSPTTHHLFPVSADSSSWSNVLRDMTFSASWGNHPLHAAITHLVEAVSLHFLSALSPSPFASSWLEANSRHLEWPLKTAGHS